MRGALVAIAVFSLLLIRAPTVHAATFNIDASVGGTTQILPFCVGGTCLHDYITPLYSFHAGDTVDLGTVILFGLFTGGRGTDATYSPDYRISFGPIPITNSTLPWPSLFSFCSPFVNPGCTPRTPDPVTVSFEFTFAEDSELQLAWTTPFQYTASVSAGPERTTSAMMLRGFASIGFMMYRRRGTLRAAA